MATRHDVRLGIIVGSVCSPLQFVFKCIGAVGLGSNPWISGLLLLVKASTMSRFFWFKQTFMLKCLLNPRFLPTVSVAVVSG